MVKPDRTQMTVYYGTTNFILDN